MKILLVLSIFLCLAGPVSADETDLYGGVLMAHHPPDLYYSGGNDWCARYNDTYGITDFADQNPRSDVMSDYDIRDIWYVVAGFFEDKIWCGTQFGLGDYDPSGWYMTSSGNCLANSLEIPTAGWPGPNTGISVAATDIAYTGNFVSVFWFEGYTYSGEPTLVPITVDPSQNFIGFGNCEAPAGVWAAEGGTMGFFTDGVAVFPSPPPILDACCDWFGVCTMLDYDTCYDSGGVPYPGEDCATFECTPIVYACCFPDGTCEVQHPDYCDLHGGDVVQVMSCDPNPCSGQPYACCFVDGTCEMLLPEDCLEADGFVYDETYCDPNPCIPSYGACCYEDGACVEMLESDCDQAVFHLMTPCDPNPCDPPSPADESSWGGIKSLYR